MGCDSMENQVLIGRVIGKLSNQIYRNIAISCSSTNMSGTQGRVLHFILSNNGDVFQKDIESEFNLRPSTATGILKLMEKNGVIRRESTPYDARLKRIVITEKGAGLKEQIAKDVVHLEETLMLGISQDDLNVFLKVLNQMLKNLEEEASF